MSKGNKKQGGKRFQADTKSINGKRQDEDKGNRKQTYIKKKISNSFHVENAENKQERRQRRNKPFIPFGTQQ